MRIVNQVQEQSFSDTKKAEFLARAELEIKYLIQPASTKKMLRELYLDVLGKPPATKLNLLNWFFDNYKFDVQADTWYFNEPYLN